MEVTVTTETIDPGIAAAILATNTHNRGVRPGLVQSLKREIADGRWMLNGESIKIADDGSLIDGQHRLIAVVEADKPITTIVVRGLASETQSTVDSGARRTFADVLMLEGEDRYAVLSAMTRNSWLLDVTGHPAAGRLAPTHGELLTYLGKNPGLRSWTTTATQTPRSAIQLPGSISGALGYQMGRLSEDDAREFWRQLLENDAKKGDAVFQLREQLIKDRLAAHPSGLVYRSAIITKAWNFWQEGKSPNLISWKASVEDFPKLRARPADAR